MKKNILKKVFRSTAIILTGFLLFPAMATATLDSPPQEHSPQDVTFELESFLTNLALWIFWIVIALAVIFILVAAIGFLTAGGNPEKIEKARSQLIYALIAVAVAVLAWGLINFVAGFFGA